MDIEIKRAEYDTEIHYMHIKFLEVEFWNGV